MIGKGLSQSISGNVAGTSSAAVIGGGAAAGKAINFGATDGFGRTTIFQLSDSSPNREVSVAFKFRVEAAQTDGTLEIPWWMGDATTSNKRLIPYIRHRSDATFHIGMQIANSSFHSWYSDDQGHGNWTGNVGQEYHAVVTNSNDGSTRGIYIDKVKRLDVNDAVSIATMDQFSIGYENDTNDRFSINLTVWDLSLFSHEFVQADVDAHHDYKAKMPYLIAGTDVVSGDLEGYWSMDEKNSTIIDRSTHGRNMIMVGSPTYSVDVSHSPVRALS